MNDLMNEKITVIIKPNAQHHALFADIMREGRDTDSCANEFGYTHVVTDDPLTFACHEGDNQWLLLQDMFFGDKATSRIVVISGDVERIKQLVANEWAMQGGTVEFFHV